MVFKMHAWVRARGEGGAKERTAVEDENETEAFFNLSTYKHTKHGTTGPHTWNRERQERATEMARSGMVSIYTRAYVRETRFRLLSHPSGDMTSTFESGVPRMVKATDSCSASEDWSFTCKV